MLVVLSWAYHPPHDRAAVPTLFIHHFGGRIPYQLNRHCNLNEDDHGCVSQRRMLRILVCHEFIFFLFHFPCFLMPLARFRGRLEAR